MHSVAVAVRTVADRVAVADIPHLRHVAVAVSVRRPAVVAVLTRQDHPFHPVAVRQAAQAVEAHITPLRRVRRHPAAAMSAVRCRTAVRRCVVLPRRVKAATVGRAAAQRWVLLQAVPPAA